MADLRDEERRFTLSAADIALLNPNTRTCPIFRSKRDAELTKVIYRRLPVLIKEGPAGRKSLEHQIFYHVPYVWRFRPIPHAGAVGGRGVATKRQSICK